MGSSFTAWKIAIILFCVTAFGLSLFGAQIWSGLKSDAELFVSDLTDDKVTWNYRYNENEGSRFSTLRTVDIHGQEMRVETVEDQEGIQQGLSDRRSMGDDEGMLFVMPNLDIHTFWMYHMLFPIDMIWLREGVVVEIAPHMLAPADTGGIPMTHTPSVLSDMVLELTAGGADRYQLKVGDKLDF